MPIYEYRRPDGTTFEIQQSFSEDALTVDPDTGVPVERVLHPPAVHFKGKGFYNTDYGTKKRQRETAAAAEGSSSSKDSSSGKDSSAKEGSSSSSAEGSSSASSSGDGAKAEKGSKESSKAKDAKPAAAKKS
jgi:predicted nucleic acid-binding Zn ribbon protein